MQCKQCQTEISSKAKYCSDKCRMQFKRNQPEQITPNKPTRTAANPNKAQPEQNPNTITDATGNVHPIDYAGRRETWANLTPQSRALALSYQSVELDSFLGIAKGRAGCG